MSGRSPRRTRSAISSGLTPSQGRRPVITWDVGYTEMAAALEIFVEVYSFLFFFYFTETTHGHTTSQKLETDPHLKWVRKKEQETVEQLQF